MQRFLSALSSPKYLVGNASVTTLLNNLKKAESRTLAWPTSNERTIRSYNSMRRETQFPDVPFAQSITSRVTLPKHREQIKKAESDKSKFYYLLNHNESKDNVRRHKSRRRSVYSSPSSTGSYAGKGSTRFLPHVNLYVVPSRPLISRQTGRQSDIKEVILKMLHDISFRKSSKERRKKRRRKGVPSNALDDAALIRDSRKVKKGRIVDMEKMPKRKERSREIQKNTGNTKESPLPLDLSTVHPKSKAKIKKPEQRNSYKKAAKSKRESVDAKEMRDYLKTIKKILPSRDSAAIYSYFNRFKRAKSIESSDDIKRKAKRRTLPNMSVAFRHPDNLERRPKKSQLIHRFEFVNREILETLEDPELINEFLRNIKQLASKECTLFRKRFMEHEKLPDVRNYMEVDRYLDHLDKTVRKARLSHQNKWKKSESSLNSKSEGDDTSQDIKKIEKMVSKGHTINKSRELLESRTEAKKRRTIDQTDQIGQNIEKTTSKSRELIDSQPEAKPSGNTIQIDSIGQILLKPYIPSTFSDMGPLERTSFDDILEELTNLSYSQEKDERSSIQHVNMSNIVGKPRLQIDLSKFTSQFEEMPFVPPASYDSMSKLTPEELSTYFTGLSRDERFSLRQFRSDHPLSYYYRVHQVKRYLRESDMSLSDLDNMSIDDIDMSEFLHYPYADKYVDSDSESKISPREPIGKIATSRKCKLEKVKPKREVDEKAAKVKVAKMSKENKELSEIRIESPKKPSCCICKLIRANRPIKDDPLIVTMKNELKRQELKAYIREKPIQQLGIDQIVNDARFKFNSGRVLAPCQKPRTVCNQIYPANVVHRNNSSLQSKALFL